MTFLPLIKSKPLDRLELAKLNEEYSDEDFWGCSFQYQHIVAADCIRHPSFVFRLKWHRGWTWVKRQTSQIPEQKNYVIVG